MTAREYLRVARALRRLTRLGETFRAGKLSYSKVRAVTRIATCDNEQFLTESALRLTAAELEKLVRSTRRGKAVEDPAWALKQRSVRQWSDDDGMGVIHARLPQADASIVWRALRTLEDQLGVSAETEDPDLECAPANERRRADALVEMGRRVLAGGEGAKRAVPLVIVHMDSRDGTIKLDDGAQIPAATAERFLCDAALVRVTHQPSGRMDVGRATRVVPAALRRALEVRDQTCQWPGCNNARYLHPHHFIHYAHGGTTCQENCGLICSFHHYLLHEGGYRLVGKAGGRLVVRAPDGRILGHDSGASATPDLEGAVGWP